MKLLDLIGLNPIKPLIAYGGDGGGGGGGGGDDDDRYIDPYEEMDRNPQNYADPNYGGGGDGPEYGTPAPVIVPEVYVPPAVVTPTTPTVRPQLRPEVLDTPTTNYQGNNLGGGGGGGNNLVGTPVGFSTRESTAPVTTTGEPIGALPSGSGSGSGNSFRETLANTFTPFDGASYQNGRLVDDRTGEFLSAGGETFSGRTIRGTFNDPSNDKNPVPQSFIDGLSLPVTNPNIGSQTKFVDPDTKKVTYQNRYDPSQLDDKWGYTRPDGTVVTAAQDIMDGGGKNFGGEVFGISGGINADLNGDGYVTKAEAQAAGGLNENFVSSLSNASGATPLGSGLDPTGIAGVLNTPVIGGALTGGLSTLYTGARYLTDNFGYEGRPESSMNQSMEDTLSGLEGQNRENAILNSTIEAAQAAAQSNQNTTGGGGGGGGGGNQGDGSNRDNLGGPNAGPARSIYNRYYKGGGGRFLPPWLQRYASGVNIDELLTRQVIDGVEYYITPEGRQIEAQYLTGAAVGAEQDI